MLFFVFVGMRQRPRERASWYHPSNSGTAACWETSAASPPTCVWLPGLLCCPSPSSRCFSCTLHRCDQTVSLSLFPQLWSPPANPCSQMGVWQCPAHNHSLSYVCWRGGHDFLLCNVNIQHVTRIFLLCDWCVLT